MARGSGYKAAPGHHITTTSYGPGRVSWFCWNHRTYPGMAIHASGSATTHYQAVKAAKAHVAAAIANDAPQAQEGPKE